LIAYLDTSALVKLYVSEDGSRALRAYASRSEALATSVVAYAEARAAFARLLRSGGTNARQHGRRLRRLNLDWDDYVLRYAGCSHGWLPFAFGPASRCWPMRLNCDEVFGEELSPVRPT